MLFENVLANENGKLVVILLCGEFPTPLLVVEYNHLLPGIDLFDIRFLPSANDVFGSDALPIANRLATRSLYLCRLESGVAVGHANKSGFDSHSLERKSVAMNRPQRFPITRTPAEVRWSTLPNLAVVLPGFAIKFPTCENTFASEANATGHQRKTLKNVKGTFSNLKK